MCLVFRTPDVELILSDRAFDEDEMAQKRLLMCPGWLVSLLLLYLAPYIKAGGPSAINPILFSRSQANLSNLRNSRSISCTEGESGHGYDCPAQK